MKKMKIILALLFGLALTSDSLAQTGRTRAQHRRIVNGARSGELTRMETRRLANEQRMIRQEKREARADGVVTAAERREIRRDTRHANRNIYRKKHNRRAR